MSLVVQWLGIYLAMQGMQVQSLVKELSKMSKMPERSGARVLQLERHALQPKTLYDPTHAATRTPHSQINKIKF